MKIKIEVLEAKGKGTEGCLQMWCLEMKSVKRNRGMSFEMKKARNKLRLKAKYDEGGDETGGGI